LAIDSTECL